MCATNEWERERETEHERDVLRSIQALGYIVSALLYSQSHHLFIRQNKFAQALIHSLSLSSHIKIIASDFLHVADGCFFFTLLFIPSACRLMCMCFVHILILLSNVCCFLLVSSLSHHTIPSQYFPLVLTTQSEIQWAENNLASAHSYAWNRVNARVFASFHSHNINQPNETKRKCDVLVASKHNEMNFDLILSFLLCQTIECSQSVSHTSYKA